MTALAPLLQAFFTDRLMTQYGASPHTITSYRDTFKLLLGFVHRQTGKLPDRLELADLDAATIGAFLQHLQTARGNGVATPSPTRSCWSTPAWTEAAPVGGGP